MIWFLAVAFLILLLLLIVGDIRLEKIKKRWLEEHSTDIDYFGNVSTAYSNISKETIPWENVKVGDVVLEGSRENINYRVLTKVDGKYWEYFDSKTGYFRGTAPEYCRYLVKGQLGCNRELMKIEYTTNKKMEE